MTAIALGRLFFCIAVVASCSLLRAQDVFTVGDSPCLVAVPGTLNGKAWSQVLAQTRPTCKVLRGSRRTSCEGWNDS